MNMEAFGDGFGDGSDDFISSVGGATETYETFPDIKPLITEDNDDYKKLVDDDGCLRISIKRHFTQSHPFAVGAWRVPFTKAKEGFSKKGRDIDRKVCFFEIDEFIDRLNKIPEAAYNYESIIKTLINKIGKHTNFSKGKAGTKSYVSLPYYSLPDLNKQLDIYFKELGIKVDEFADEQLSYEKRVKVEAFKCMEKARKMTKEKDFYPIRSDDIKDENAQFYTSGDVFKKPGNGWESCSIERNAQGLGDTTKNQ